MKTFYRDGYSPSDASRTPGFEDSSNHVPVVAPGPDAQSSARVARLAIYDTPAAAPRTVDVEAGDDMRLIEDLSVQTYTLARDLGGPIPYTVVREVAENFIHADFTEPVVSILDGGNTIRFADQGPGIADKERAKLPGFTTATYSMKRVIRGVGSGLPIVREYLSHSGGELQIDDNLGRGAVVTVRSGLTETQLSAQPSAGVSAVLNEDPGEKRPLADLPAFPPLSTRQKRVLSLVLEIGEAGPTVVSKELSIALSTAHRDLAHLEQNGLITSDETGKRILTSQGSSYLDSLFSL